jgi:hypothetical protein
MSDLDRPLTLREERLAYRRAVQRILVVFFEKSPSEATSLVDSWWKRMGTGQAFRTGLFMHHEPINTAASLAKAAKAPAIRELGDQYVKIIQESMPKRRLRHKKENIAAAQSAHAA